MARTEAVVPGGVRLTDYLGVGVIAKVFPLAVVQEALRISERRRALPAEAVVYYVIAASLFRASNGREVLRCLADGLRLTQAGTGLRLVGRSALSKARLRLGPEPFRALRRLRVQPVADARTPGAHYRGLRLLAYDGTTLNLPDEVDNREEFGLPGSGRGQAAFPQARVTALVEIGTRAAFAWEYGPYREAERVQAEHLHAHLSSGSLLLADRGFTGSGLWRSAVRAGADLLWRVRRDTELPVRGVLPDGSYLSTFADAPARVVEYTLADGQPDPYRLLTTLLDPARGPAAELAALYHERWEIESTYDEIKTHLLGRHPILRAKTPELVEQEIEGLMLAHYAVRHFLHEAACTAGQDPDRLSFTHAVSVVRRRIQNPGAFPPLWRRTHPWSIWCAMRFWKSAPSRVAAKASRVGSSKR